MFFPPVRHSHWFRQWRPSQLRSIQNHALGDSKFKILFMGRDEFSCIVLQALFEASDVWQGISVATQPDTYIGRRKSTLAVSPLRTFAEKFDLPVHFIPENKADFKRWQLPPPFYESLRPNESPTLPNPEHLLVTASFGRILTARQLEHFLPGRRLNVHPSLLPSYRGPAPIQHALLNGDKESGVCIIEMLKKKEGIDAGDLWGKTRTDVPPNATFSDLRALLAAEGGKLLVSVLRQIKDGRAEATPQPEVPNSPFAPMIVPTDALVDFTKMTAEQINQRFRAISHQKPLLTHISDIPLQLQRVNVIPSSGATGHPLPSTPGAAIYDKATKSLLVRCAQGSVLGVTHVKQEGRNLVHVKEWWNGLRDAKRPEGVLLGFAKPL